jgi:acyl carrier protein
VIADSMRHGSHSPAPTVLEGVRTVLRTHLAIAGPVEPTTALREELQLDSLAQLTLIVELENHFRVCFETVDEQEIETVGDVVEVIEKHLFEQGKGHA